MRTNMTPLNQRMSEFNPLNTQASSRLRHMACYMPALTPVIVRPRNGGSRLFATPTPDDKRAKNDEESEDGEEAAQVSQQLADGLYENRNAMRAGVANSEATSPTAAASVQPFAADNSNRM